MVENLDQREIRAALEAEREEMLERIAEVKGRPDPGDDLDNPDITETASDYDILQRASALEEIFQLRLVYIDQALQRLDEGIYGNCAKCGEEISLERLRVDPLAKFCNRCEEYPLDHEPPIHSIG